MQFYMKNDGFIPEGLGESQHMKEKTTLNFVTDKTYVKAFQGVPTTEAPQAQPGLDEPLKGCLQLPYEGKSAEQAPPNPCPEGHSCTFSGARATPKAPL